jgi:hypothetical protein
MFRKLLPSLSKDKSNGATSDTPANDPKKETSSIFDMFKSSIKTPPYLIQNVIVCFNQYFATNPYIRKPQSMCIASNREIGYKCNIPTIFSTPSCIKLVIDTELTKHLPKIWIFTRNINDENTRTRISVHKDNNKKPTKLPHKEFIENINLLIEKLYNDINTYTTRYKQGETQTIKNYALDGILIMTINNDYQRILDECNVFNAYCKRVENFNLDSVDQTTLKPEETISPIDEKTIIQVSEIIKKFDEKENTIIISNTKSSKEVIIKQTDAFKELIQKQNKTIETNKTFTDKTNVQITNVENDTYIIQTLLDIIQNKEELDGIDIKPIQDHVTDIQTNIDKFKKYNISITECIDEVNSYIELRSKEPLQKTFEMKHTIPPYVDMIPLYGKIVTTYGKLIPLYITFHKAILKLYKDKIIKFYKEIFEICKLQITKAYGSKDEYKAKYVLDERNSIKQRFLEKKPEINSNYDFGINYTPLFENNNKYTPSTMCSKTFISNIVPSSVASTIATVIDKRKENEKHGFGGKKTYKKRPPIRRGKKSRKSKK